MKIVWDEHKRWVNIKKHGLDFAELNEAFFRSAIIRPAKFGSLAAIGKLGNGTIAAIFLQLGTEGISVVSMRPASKRERSYQE